MVYDEDWSRLVGCNLKDLRDGNSPFTGGQSLNLAQWRAPGQVVLFLRLLSKLYLTQSRRAGAIYEPMTSVLAGSVTTEPGSWFNCPKTEVLGTTARASLSDSRWTFCKLGLDVTISLNAWLPRVVFIHLKVRPIFLNIFTLLNWLLARAQDCLEVYGQTTGKFARYETFIPVAPHARSKSAFDKLLDFECQVNPTRRLPTPGSRL